jgi:hypothetical protein
MSIHTWEAREQTVSETEGMGGAIAMLRGCFEGHGMRIKVLPVLYCAQSFRGGSNTCLGAHCLCAHHRLVQNSFVAF